jgi:hypothetical protein
MKRVLAVVSAFVFTLVLSSGALAATSKTLTVENQLQVGNATLQPGDYKVTYDESSPNPQVTFDKGKQKVTVPAHVKNLGAKTNNTSVIVDTTQKVPVLQEIDFGGSTQGLVLTGGENANNSGQ